MEIGKNTDNLKIDILSGVREPMHEHAEAELLYVLEGECVCTIGKVQYVLGRRDVLLVNSGEPHSVMADHRALVSRIRIPCRDPEVRSSEEPVRFFCNSLAETGFKYTELREHLHLLLLDYAEPGKKRLYGQLGQYYLLLDRLLKDFRKEGGLQTADGESGTDGRLLRSIQYIHANLGEKISLSEIAGILCMSPSTFSRFFRRETGMFFNHYVKKARLEKVAEALVETDLPVTRLSVEYGFANPSVMSTGFKSVYGITPGEYRRQSREAAGRKRSEQAAGKERLRGILESEKEQMNHGQEKTSVCVDAGSGRPYKMWKNRIANIGPAHILETAGMREHVLLLKDQLDIEYVRIWNLFSERLMLREKGGSDINFSRLDEILDFCVENRLKLFLDLAPRTNTAKASENRNIYSTEEGILFESQRDWENCLAGFCRHLVRRYGKDTASTWIFEISFFLNARPYFVSDVYSPGKVWAGSRKIIKSVIPGAAVAGPGLKVVPDPELTESLIRSFLKQDACPDIFTSYNFPYDEEAGNLLCKTTDVQFLGKQIEMIQFLLKKYDFKGKYYITDWNNSLANRNYIQDSCYRGTFVLKNVLDNYDRVDEMGVWYASDLLNVYYDTKGILSGSAGMLTKDGIRKPVFYACRFLTELGSSLIAKGENYIVTENDREDIRILCFNNKNLSPEYYLVEEDRHRPEEISGLFQNRDRLDLQIRLEHLPFDGTVLIRQKIVNETGGSILNEWIRMGCEEDLLPEDVRYLRRISVPEVKIRRETVKDHALELHLELEPHEIRWLSVTPE